MSSFGSSKTTKVDGIDQCSIHRTDSRTRTETGLACGGSWGNGLQDGGWIPLPIRAICEAAEEFRGLFAVAVHDSVVQGSPPEIR